MSQCYLNLGQPLPYMFDSTGKLLLKYFENKACIHTVSEWLLFNTNSAIFQLHHG
jgi:hypothetical protein